MVEAKANPAPLGLLAFGLTTVLLNLHNAGFLGSASMGMIMAMGIFYGGIAQMILGISGFLVPAIMSLENNNGHAVEEKTAEMAPVPTCVEGA